MTAPGLDDCEGLGPLAAGGPRFGTVRFNAAGADVAVEMCETCVAAVLSTMTVRFRDAVRAQNDVVSSLMRQLGIEVPGVISHRAVGRLRRVLMIRGSHRWNGWVRDLTARLG